jgi:hypothetical protein
VVCVKRAVCRVSVYRDFVVAVALPDNAAGALFQISRTPRAVYVVRGYQTVLDVGACAHLKRTAEQYAHTSLPHLCEQFFFLRFSVGVVNESYLMFGYAALYQLCANVVIDVETPVFVRRGKIRKDQLRQFVASRFLPYLIHSISTGVYLAALKVGQKGIYKALVKPDFTSVRRVG